MSRLFNQLIGFCTSFTILVLVASHSSAREAKIHFSNGDTLNGSITSIDSKKISFTHPAFPAPYSSQELDLGQIHRIVYLDEIQKVSTASVNSQIEMTSRSAPHIPTDIYKGNIEDINENAIFLQTPFAGELKLNKPFIKSLQMFDSKLSILPSLGSLSEWKMSLTPPTIKEVENAFHLGSADTSDRTARFTQYIYRTIKYPDLYIVEFEIDRSENKTSDFFLTLHGNENGSSIGENTALLIDGSRYGIRIMRQQRTGGNNQIGNAKITGDLYQQDIWRVRVSVNLNKEELSFKINDQELITTQPITNLNRESLGSTIGFGTSSGEGVVRLNHLTVTKWNGGQSPKSANKRIPLLNKKSEYKAINLHNGDIIYGMIKSINQGIAQIENQHGKFQIKLDHIADLDLGVLEPTEILMEENDARITFNNGSRFIIKIVDIKDNTLTGLSQVFEGQQEFDMKQIRSIDFEHMIYSF